jgi:hypothetical protein
VVPSLQVTGPLLLPEDEDAALAPAAAAIAPAGAVLPELLLEVLPADADLLIPP